jgi:hypothetical protein
VVCQLLEFPFQMGPTDLPPPQGPPGVDCPAIAGPETNDALAQQGFERRETSAGADPEGGHLAEGGVDELVALLPWSALRSRTSASSLATRR